MLAKVITVLVPYLYAFATDALAPKANVPEQTLMWLTYPVAMVVAYNIGRILLNVSTTCAMRCSPTSASMPFVALPI